MWIDCDSCDKPGDIGVRLQVVDNSRRGITRHTFISDVPRTNQSREPKVRGWLGETNNMSWTAQGIVRITRMNADCDKALVRKATPAEARAWLKKQGHSSLAGETV